MSNEFKAIYIGTISTCIYMIAHAYACLYYSEPDIIRIWPEAQY